MAVYTQLSRQDVSDFLESYSLGVLNSATGITEGIENTNYLLETSSGKYILTLFEKRTQLEDLPYFAALMQHLHGHGIPCPLPVARRDGCVLGALKERPALIVTFLEGSGAQAIRLEHLPQLGKLAAQMHIAGMDFPHQRQNKMSFDGWGELIEKIDSRADEIEPGLLELIAQESRFLSEHWPSGLPSGPIHTDLFPDNVFFHREHGASRLSGVIDFYFACNDAWSYDLAVCINAWCFDDRHRFVPERVQALMAAYNDIRPMQPEEEQAMPILLRGAALRFLLTRTYDWLNTPEGALVNRKDPKEYYAKLRYFQKEPS